jgi:hypothetical protein
MGPRKFLDDVVRPNIAEFTANRIDVRLAFNTVASVDALAGQLYVWCKTNAPAELAAITDDHAYRAKLASDNSDFRLIRDIAKAQKHVELNQGKPLVSSAKQVESKSLGYSRGGYGEGGYSGSPQVVVKMDDGQFRVVGAAVTNALAFLEAEAARLGVP